MSSTGGPVGSRVAEHLSMLAAAVDGLLDAGLTGLSDGDVVDMMRGLERSLRRAEAVSHRLVVESVERAVPVSLGYTSPRKFLIDVLRISGADASARVTAARELGVWHTLAGDPMAPVFPETAAAQCDGDIGTDHARAIARVMRKIPHAVGNDAVADAEAVLARLARTGTPEDVEQAGHRLLAYLNPDGNLGDDRDRKRRRGISIGRQDTELMSRISGELDPVARVMLDPILAKWARPGMNNPDDPGSPTGDGEDPSVDRDMLAAAAARDTRTAAQRNHDAFSAVFRALLESGVLGRHRGLPATVIVTMTLEQLEKAVGGLATTATGGLLPIADALALAEDAHPVLALFDHAGRPLHLGRRRRLATADQRLALIAADGGCTRPGCAAPSSLCAVHHVTDWHKGGRTDVDGLALVCDACHAQVNDGAAGWTTRSAPDRSDYPGRTEWIPPPHIDSTRRPRINHRHHPGELIEHARGRGSAPVTHSPPAGAADRAAPGWAGRAAGPPRGADSGGGE
ncbi:HNH endonuclease signature motif containing protein [Rhodococcus sp. NCIMB 12038]|uniref:HNH endonuclease signature motif containing protein n=1 Tax=Rhodococcus sp. NCIMB 12038 TaxID=933800 RepID=UPI00211AD103|nr:HNH endonuclease signature motif containing protein [Rhodococcus sp. NCIMB 12038]